jgi:hypothetical protein
VTLLNIHRPRDRSHYERFEAFHAAFYRSVEATSVTPFASRALDRALPAVTVALARHMRAKLTPPMGAINAVDERAELAGIPDVLAVRVSAHRVMEPTEVQRLQAVVRARANDLLDSWASVARRQRETGARLRYQAYEGNDGPALLHTPLDPELSRLDRDARKFKAPRSLRDVEPSVNLWLKTLEGAEITAPDDEEGA